MNSFTNVFLKCVLTLLLSGLFQEVFSQNETNTKKNIIYMEGGGAFVAGVGLGYERYLHLNPIVRTSIRAGLGLVDHFSMSSYFGGSSLLIGRKYSMEIGVNYLINYDASVFRSLDLDDEKFDNGVQALIGYRYQNWENGLTFRIFYAPPIGCCGTPIPIYIGASVGYAF